MRVLNMIINRETGTWAVYGGMLLGGGGGGDIQEGLRILDLALSYAQEIPLRPLSEIDPQAIILTASLVGSPASKERYVAPAHYQRVYQIFRQQYPGEIGGIITNEMGAQSSTNGWVLAAMTGLPLIDAPCNGRAHPTGVMGALGLAEEKGYRSIQVGVGGREHRETEIYVSGDLGTASSLIRSAASAAGGFVTVLRNPVTADYVAKHAAVGALSHSIKVGQVLYRELGNADAVVEALANTLGVQEICRGVISDHDLNITEGFDLGTLTIETDGLPVTISFWNEYMTAERGGVRLATFPDLIAVLDGESGLPQTSAMVHVNQEVILIKLGYEQLLLGSSMRNRRLFEEAERYLKRDLVKYVF
jgi:DUF917 family protein